MAYTKEEIKQRITPRDAIQLWALQSYFRVFGWYSEENAIEFLDGVYGGKDKIPDYMKQLAKEVFGELEQSQ